MRSLGAGRRRDRRPAVDKATRRSRRRFARRQWRRRWLAWRYVPRWSSSSRWSGGGIWAVWFSSWLAVETIDVSGAQTVEADDIRARSRHRRGRAAGPGRPGRGRAPDRVAGGGPLRRRHPAVARTDPDRHRGAGRDRGGRDRRPAARHGRRRRGVPRLQARRRPGLPRVETSIGTTSEALREAAKVISALPEELTLIVDHVQVTTVDQISLVLKDGRTVVWGSADESETKAEVLEDPARDRAGAGLRRQRAVQAHDPVTERSRRAEKLVAGGVVSRRSPRVATTAATRRPYCRRHGQVDITITLSLRVTVEAEESGSKPWQQRRTTSRSSRSSASAVAASTPSTG